MLYIFLSLVGISYQTTFSDNITWRKKIGIYCKVELVKTTNSSRRNKYLNLGLFRCPMSLSLHKSEFFVVENVTVEVDFINICLT